MSPEMNFTNHHPPQTQTHPFFSLLRFVTKASTNPKQESFNETRRKTKDRERQRKGGETSSRTKQQSTGSDQKHIIRNIVDRNQRNSLHERITTPHTGCGTNRKTPTTQQTEGEGNFFFHLKRGGKKRRQESYTHAGGKKRNCTFFF